MLRNYLVIAFRSLRKNPLYSTLNVSGLAIGVAACLLILLFVAHEWSYDRWNPQAERIVRPTYQIKVSGFEENHAAVDARVGPDAAAVLPDIEAWCRIRHFGTWNTRLEGQPVEQGREEMVLGVDSSFFEVFPLQVIAGDARHCLNQPSSVAISRSQAEHYFSSPEQALGQILLMGRIEQRQQVTAVFEDAPVNSHFHADVLLPLTGNEEVKNAPAYWGYNNNFFTYFLLRKDSDKAAFAKKFTSLAESKVSVLVKDLFNTTTADFEKAGQRTQFGLQNLTDIHLYSAKQSELEANGNIRYVWIFGAIAFFILLIACINFMNLSTARYTQRAREVGVRKVLGSSRFALAGQFLTESIALSALAMLLATALAALAMPAFRELAGREIAMPFANPIFWAALLGGAVVVGLLAGSYPAFFLSAFQSAQVLKGSVGGNLRSGGLSLRNGLVVFQFTISSVLIMTTLLVYSQMQYMQNKNLGFDKSQVLILDNARALSDRLEAFKTTLLNDSRVESASITNYLPLPGSDRENCILSPTQATGENDKILQRWQVDGDYIRTLGLEMKKGRNFEPGRTTDSSSIIINEAAARELGFADPIGQKMYTSRTKAVDSKPEDFNELTIIGVVRDFNYESLHAPIGGLFLQLGRGNAALSIRFRGADAAPVIAGLERTWKDFNPGQAPRYRFMDESLNRMYGAEQRIGKIALLFALLSIFVSCLGLFGLATFTAEQRTKEIGIRKVLGASVAGVTRLLTLDFLKLVVLAIVIASPVAGWVMQQWLQDFAYRIDIQWWMFVVAGLVAVTIAFLTVGVQSVRAALADPVRSLRSE